MKTIKDLTTDNINRIYSLIIGEDKTADKINWSENHDFVIAIFRSDDCKPDDVYDTIECGINIDKKLQVFHVWNKINSQGICVEHRPLYNHHEITKYMIAEGFSIYRTKCGNN